MNNITHDDHVPSAQVHTQMCSQFTCNVCTVYWIPVVLYSLAVEIEINTSSQQSTCMPTFSQVQLSPTFSNTKDTDETLNSHHTAVCMPDIVFY